MGRGVPPSSHRGAEGTQRHGGYRGTERVFRAICKSADGRNVEPTLKNAQPPHGARMNEDEEQKQARQINQPPTTPNYQPTTNYLPTNQKLTTPNHKHPPTDLPTTNQSSVNMIPSHRTQVGTRTIPLLPILFQYDFK